MPKLPKIHSRSEHDPGHLFKVEKLELEFSNGVQRTYERLQSKGLGAVIVVPMIDDDTVLLVSEYAAGLHHYELGLVTGRLDPGESFLEAAQRELKEEAGFGAHSLIEINQLALAPAYMTHVTHVILARDLYPEKLEGDEPEPLGLVRWPINDLHSLVQRPDCTEGRTIAALYMARDYLKQGSNS
jgi:ADP-ribose diphosphatase